MERLALLVETFPDRLRISRESQFCFWPNEAPHGFFSKKRSSDQNPGLDFDRLNVFYLKSVRGLVRPKTKLRLADNEQLFWKGLDE